MKPNNERADTRYMRLALALARRGLGKVAPNPAVGCVIVNDAGYIVGRGWTANGGRPHAETEALKRAGTAARGATTYVTLEPCAHHGETPPCAQALIDAGIATAVVALRDPDPRVDGGGCQMLRDAGIEVREGVCEAEAAALNAGFLMKVRARRPMVTLKAATTLDGRIATQTGDSQWITGPEARALGHLLRATHDAILVGAGTANEDNPELTCRLPGLADASPVRVVLDGRLRVPVTHKLVETAKKIPVHWFALDSAIEENVERAGALREAGVELIAVGPDSEGRLDIGIVLEELAASGITRVLVEGGGTVAASFMEQDLVDRIAWFRSSTVIGGDGVPVIGGFGVRALAESRNFTRRAFRAIGNDVIEYLERYR